jgi:hypothetical protein
MAQFGWAYVNCADSGGGSHAGPLYSVQFITGSGNTSGSSNLIFDPTTNVLSVNGNVSVVGNITASVFVTDQTVTTSGSTIFGNSTDDTHQMTGSLFVGPSASAPIFSVSTSTSQAITTGFRVSYQSVTASGFTSSNDNYIIGVGGTGDLELRIHSASTAVAGALLMVKDEASSRTGKIIVSASSGETIDGDPHYELSGSSPAIGLYSNGSNWFVI